MPFIIIPKPSNLTTGSNPYVLPFALITSLFFLWGLAYGLLDVLNKHFQNALQVTKQHSMLLQAAYFGAYFLMALPAGMFMNRYGYKKGIVVGLLLYAGGAFLFYPSASSKNFLLFVTAIFILASGLAFLETAANPYASVLGEENSSTFRLNLAQSFNGIGAFIGPIVGASLFFGSSVEQSNLESLQAVYLVIGSIVLMVAALFIVVRLPEIESPATRSLMIRKLFAFPNFRNAVITQFFYVAAQVGSAALFINYCVESTVRLSEQEASYLLSAGLLLFTAGRFIGTVLMKYVEPSRLLTAFAGANIILCLIIVSLHSAGGILALLATFFFNSIMFPTIFALGLKGLGEYTKKGSSFIIMSVAGGAIMPIVMGSFSSTATAFWIPLVCFFIVLHFGWRGQRTNANQPMR